MATGVYPEHSGLMANREYRPEADPLQAGRHRAARDHPEWLRPLSGNVPTVAQMLHAAGRATAVAGSKGVALLQDWSHDGKTEAARESTVLLRWVERARGGDGGADRDARPVAGNRSSSPISRRINGRPAR
jgi:hypothetical protein